MGTSTGRSGIVLVTPINPIISRQFVWSMASSTIVTSRFASITTMVAFCGCSLSVKSFREFKQTTVNVSLKA